MMQSGLDALGVGVTGGGANPQVAHYHDDNDDDFLVN